MTVITISRQIGSLGGQIAREVAELLGYRLVERELINQSALRAGAPAAALAVIDELGLLGISLSKREVQGFRKALRQVIGELYKEGNIVILGRAGQVILHGQRGVLHVRVIAPVKLRAERVAARRQIAYENAVAQVEATDENRSKFLKRLFKIDWDDPLLYDLVIDTAQLNVSQSVRLIAQSVTSLPGEKLAGIPS